MLGAEFSLQNKKGKSIYLGTHMFANVDQFHGLYIFLALIIWIFVRDAA